MRDDAMGAICALMERASIIRCLVDELSVDVERVTQPLKVFGSGDFDAIKLGQMTGGELDIQQNKASLLQLAHEGYQSYF